MNYVYHCQNFILMHKKGYYKYFQTSCIFYSQNDYFAQNLLNLDLFSLIFGKINQHCAKFYTNSGTNMETTMLSIFCDFCMKFEYFATKV